MNPDMNHNWRRLNHRREQRDGRALIRGQAHARRQRKFAEFLQKGSGKQQSIIPQEKRAEQDSKSEDENEVTLPDELLFKIFSLLPAESYVNLKIVCKKWLSLINCSDFIKLQKEQSDTVLISRELFVHGSNPPPSFLVLPSLEKPKAYFHYVELNSGNDNFIESGLIDTVDIRASCDGLLLGIIAKKNRLILMNTITRKHTKIPLGTIGFDECYGFSFCIEAKTYKVVHLFREKSGYTGCEILNVSTRKWTIMNGPCSELLHDIKQMPVSVFGSLNWMPREHGCDYFVSIDLKNEEFVTKKLPIFCAVNDRLIDIGGVLGFVTHATLNLMQVWILMERGGPREKWVKRYSINLNFDVTRVVPICSSRNGKEIVFEYPGRFLYVYDFENGYMKKVYSIDGEDDYEGAEKIFIPHRNTLASWEDYH